MKAFFLFYGPRRELEQMFEEEEDTKKQKTIDLDDLSLEEIEDLIKNHEKEIKSLKSLLKKKTR